LSIRIKICLDLNFTHRILNRLGILSTYCYITALRAFKATWSIIGIRLIQTIHIIIRICIKGTKVAIFDWDLVKISTKLLSIWSFTTPFGTNYASIILQYEYSKIILLVNVFNTHSGFQKKGKILKKIKILFIGHLMSDTWTSEMFSKIK
jgi:hypothetical protein